MYAERVYEAKGRYVVRTPGAVAYERIYVYTDRDQSHNDNYDRDSE